jgi:hypothetical protein
MPIVCRAEVTVVTPRWVKAMRKWFWRHYGADLGTKGCRAGGLDAFTTH